MGKVRMKNKFSKIKFLKFKMDYWATFEYIKQFCINATSFSNTLCLVAWNKKKGDLYHHSVLKNRERQHKIVTVITIKGFSKQH